MRKGDEVLEASARLLDLDGEVDPGLGEVAEDVEDVVPVPALDMDPGVEAQIQPQHVLKGQLRQTCKIYKKKYTTLTSLSCLQ